MRTIVKAGGLLLLGGTAWSFACQRTTSKPPPAAGAGRAPTDVPTNPMLLTLTKQGTTKASASPVISLLSPQSPSFGLATTPEPTTKLAGTRRSAPPPAPFELTINAEAGALALVWPKVGAASGYTVVRSSVRTPQFRPTAGTGYTSNASAGNGETIVSDAPCSTAASTDPNDKTVYCDLVDSSLSPSTVYYYAVFARDDARNYAASVTGSGQPLPYFGGLTRLGLIGPGRAATADWQVMEGGVDDPTAFTYRAYGGPSGAEDFSDPVASVAGLATMNLTLATGTASAIVVRATNPAGIEDTNTNEAMLRLAPGFSYRIAGDRFYNGVAAAFANIDAPLATAVDAWSNVVFAANTNLVYVLCQESAAAPYCLGRGTGRVYTVAGADGFGDAANGVPAMSPLGQVGGLAVDALGNIYIGDVANFKVRVVCNNVSSSTGACAGLTRGYVYTLLGTGTAGPSPDGAVATASPTDQVYGLAVDRYGNVVVGDANAAYIYGLCYAASGPMCSGKTIGNVYQVAGNGGANYGASGAAAGPIGNSYGVALDASGNIYYAGGPSRNARVVCLAASGAYCTGKTAGFAYTIAGNGSSGTGGNDVDPTATGFGTPWGIMVDPSGNVSFTDTNNDRVFTICYKPTTGICKSATAGYIYYAAGTGMNGNDQEGDSTLAAISSSYSLASDSLGNFALADTFNWLIKIVCVDPAGGLCLGRAKGVTYTLAGTGGWPKAPVNGESIAHLDLMHHANGFATDSTGNLYVAFDQFHTIVAFCYDVTSTATFCTGKTKNAVYTVAGGGAAPVADGAAYGSVYFTQVGGLAVDAFDNLLIAHASPSSRSDVFVLCQNTSGSAGFCAGKVAGSMYVVVGDGHGTSSPAGDGVTAAGSGASAGVIAGLAADSFGNLFYFDTTSTDYRVHLVCAVTTATALNPCSSSTVRNDGWGGSAATTAGKTYYYAGKSGGGSGNAATAGAATSSAVGTVYGMTVDALNNLYLADATSSVIRKIDLANNHTLVLVQGKGSGTGGKNGADGQMAATSGDTGAFGNALAADVYGNLFFDDSTYHRIRVICQSTQGFCAGKTPGGMYGFTATNSNGRESASNTLATAALVGSAPNNADLLVITKANDVFYIDTGLYTLRYFIGF